MDKKERIEFIKSLRNSGETLQAIGDRLNISRERVRQICAVCEIPKPKVAAKRNKLVAAKKVKPIAVKVAREGQLTEQAARVFATEMGLKDPVKAFRSHKVNATRRGIAFLLTFDEWWALWRDSYKYRGRSGKVMCRYLDKGAYEVGNVRIDDVSGNAHERGVVNKMSTCQRADRSPKRTKHPKDFAHFFGEKPTFGINPLRKMLVDEESIG